MFLPFVLSNRRPFYRLDPHSAVHLEVIDDDPTTSYINANYVRVRFCKTSTCTFLYDIMQGYNMRPREYIATQGKFHFYGLRFSRQL